MRGVEIVVAADSREAERRAALDAPGIRYATASTSACLEGASSRTIGTLVVTPGGGSGAVVVVAAFGGVKVAGCIAPNFAPGCIVARRRFAFADYTAATLPIVLDPVCSGVPCNESSTCVGKKCVDSAVDCVSGTCTDPGQTAPDGGRGGDGHCRLLDRRRYGLRPQRRVPRCIVHRQSRLLPLLVGLERLRSADVRRPVTSEERRRRPSAWCSRSPRRARVRSAATRSRQRPRPHLRAHASA